MDNADRIAFATLIFVGLATLLPLLRGAVQWLISLQSFRSVQARDLEQIRRELDAYAEHLDSRVATDLRVATQAANNEARIEELERRVGELERRL